MQHSNRRAASGDILNFIFYSFLLKNQLIVVLCFFCVALKTISWPASLIAEIVGENNSFNVICPFLQMLFFLKTPIPQRCSLLLAMRI